MDARRFEHIGREVMTYIAERGKSIPLVKDHPNLVKASEELGISVHELNQYIEVMDRALGRLEPEHELGRPN
ncbi:MAG: hypothetical protein Q7S15_01535 [bacterium]|nr:hypothetical protein [bacterium]